MSEMVERVMGAIMSAEYWIGGQRSIAWEQAARSAIEAMREPTKAMYNAAYIENGTSPDEAFDAWQSMIDEALKEQR